MENKVIESIKELSQGLWDKIQEAKKLNLKVALSFNDTLGRKRPEIEISKTEFYQDSI